MSIEYDDKTLRSLLNYVYEKKHIKNPGLTRRKVAMEIGVPENSLYRWMNSDAIPEDLKTFDKLAEFAGYHVYNYLGDNIPDGIAYLLAYRDRPIVEKMLRDIVESVLSNIIHAEWSK